MTFSGDFPEQTVIAFVSQQLGKLGLLLNHQKTRLCTQGSCQQVTGIVVNEKVNVPSIYRRTLRQQVYFCRKYGVEAHMSRLGETEAADAYLRRMLGQVRYVLQVCPNNQEFRDYEAWLSQTLREYSRQ